MKRDMELVRLLLIAAEGLKQGTNASNLQIEGFSEDQVIYHTALLHDAGFIAAEPNGNLDGADFCILRLTWDGHEFLDAARDATRWKQVRGAITKVGGATLPVWQSLLEQVLRGQLGL